LISCSSTIREKSDRRLGHVGSFSFHLDPLLGGVEELPQHEIEVARVHAHGEGGLPVMARFRTSAASDWFMVCMR
jgi:hypothetical protein